MIQAHEMLLESKSEGDIRVATVVQTGGFPMGKVKADRGLVILNSTLDQAVDVRVRGRGHWAREWQNADAAATTVAALTGTESIAVDAAWYEIQLHITPAAAPTTGTLIAELCTAFG